MSKNDNPRSIKREATARPNVSYSKAVVLHETTQRRIVMVPFFIQHHDHTELAAKIVTYLKSPPPNDWAESEEKSLSLKEPAARELYKALRDHLKVASENADGSFLVIRVGEGTADISEHDPAAVASALTKVLGQREIMSHLADTELSDALVHAFRGAIRLKEMTAAVAELRRFLSEDETSEQIYQEWCVRHSWAFGNAYVMTGAVRDISASDRLDLLLPTVISGYRDIVELKRPDVPVLLFDTTHQNFYFSADVSKAVGQAHRYLDVLHDVAANGLRDHPEIVAYHPRAIIVIGRSAGWAEGKLRALHGLNRRLTGLTIMTYDHLLAQGERLVEILSAPLEEEDALNLDMLGDDDVPF
jgi:hypothetical protein